MALVCHIQGFGDDVMGAYELANTINITKAIFAIVALVCAAFSNDCKGYFVFAAILIFLLGGASVKTTDTCPECGVKIEAGEKK